MSSHILSAYDKLIGTVEASHCWKSKIYQKIDYCCRWLFFFCNFKLLCVLIERKKISELSSLSPVFLIKFAMHKTNAWIGYFFYWNLTFGRKFCRSKKNNRNFVNELLHWIFPANKLPLKLSNSMLVSLKPKLSSRPKWHASRRSCKFT